MHARFNERDQVGMPTARKGVVKHDGKVAGWHLLGCEPLRGCGPQIIQLRAWREVR